MKKIAYLLLISLILMMTAGCAKTDKPVESEEKIKGQSKSDNQTVTESEKKEEEKKKEEKPVKNEKVTLVLDWLPNTNHTGFYVAVDQGYYEAEGLSVDIVQPSNSGSLELVAAGQGDFGVSYQEQVTYARTADSPLPIKAVAAIIQHNTSGFAAPADKEIKTPKDFENHRYGGWGSPMEEAMLKALMEKSDADYNLLENVNVGEIDFFTATKDHIDFAWIYYGWDGVKAELNQTAIDFIKLQDVDPELDFYTPLIVASEKTLADRSELVKKFLRATAKGYQFAIDQPTEAADILVKAAPEIDRDLAVASQKYLANEYLADAPRWGEMKLTTWQTFAEWMIKRELLADNFEAAEAFTNDYLPEK